MAIKVTLREKPISGNRLSLYLDFYPAILNTETGKETRREFLKLYLYQKAGSPIDKQHNKETLNLARQIRQKRENTLNKPEIYTEHEKELKKAKEIAASDFLAYFKGIARKRKSSNYDNWASAYNYLERYTDGRLKVGDLNEQFCDGFKEYLQTAKSTRSDKSTLSTNSAVSYYNKFKAALRLAYKDGLLPNDLNAKIAPIKQVDTHRNYLTIEELQNLIKPNCKSPLLKKAALFSALTGLRFSDIQKLVWGEVRQAKEGEYVIQFTQQKN